MRFLAIPLLAASLAAGAAHAKPVYPDTTEQTERAYPVRMMLKLSRGITNLAFFWLEPLTNPIKEGWRIENAGGNTLAVASGMTAGVFTGTAYAVARAGTGAFDLVSFPVATGAIMNPETPFGFFETLGTDDAEHRMVRVTPPHRIEPEPPRRLGIDHGL